MSWTEVGRVVVAATVVAIIGVGAGACASDATVTPRGTGAADHRAAVDPSGSGHDAATAPPRSPAIPSVGWVADDRTLRRRPSPDVLPPPADDAFHASVEPVPADVAARSTWHPGCPVDLEDLRYVTVSFWGFDDRPHTGELLLHRSVAHDVAGAFRELFAARFPIEAMRVPSPADLSAPPTGDANVSGGFVCRPVVGGTRWSNHASGLAVDINPFQNPYARGAQIVPEQAGSYVDRSVRRPGMIVAGDVVTAAFADIGWEWGGAWAATKDWMHFSHDGH